MYFNTDSSETFEMSKDVGYGLSPKTTIGFCLAVHNTSSPPSLYINWTILISLSMDSDFEMTKRLSEFARLSILQRIHFMASNTVLVL